MATTKWALDPSHSELTFKVRHMMISNISGSFNKYAASAQMEDENIDTAKATFTAEIDSITTNNEQRDGHLKSVDFFDAANFPELKFVTTKLEKKGNDGTYDIYGDLTLRGVTKNIKVTAEFGGVIKDPYNYIRSGITVSGKINRKEFGLSWHAALEAGGVVASDDVNFNLGLEFIKEQ